MRTAIPLCILALASGIGTGNAREAVSPARASRCIDPGRIVSRQALAPEVLSLTLTGGQRYLSRLPAPCPHLEEIDRTYILQLEEAQGRQLCAGDRFRVVDPVVARAGGVQSFPVCRFGPFERQLP